MVHLLVGEVEAGHPGDRFGGEVASPLEPIDE